MANKTAESFGCNNICHGTEVNHGYSWLVFSLTVLLFRHKEVALSVVWRAVTTWLASIAHLTTNNPDKASNDFVQNIHAMKFIQEIHDAMISLCACFMIIPCIAVNKSLNRFLHVRMCHSKTRSETFIGCNTPEGIIGSVPVYNYSFKAINQSSSTWLSFQKPNEERDLHITTVSSTISTGHQSFSLF